MSLLRRLASEALPAPSTRTRSASRFSLAKLSSTCGISVALIAWYSAARATPNTLPCTTICAPISLCGFSSTGFIWTLGATRAARACSACARPISPPSAVTAALFDMFCGLNGRTRSPRLAKARARPATISDLPTSEPVPWNMMARAVMGLGVRSAIGSVSAFLRAPLCPAGHLPHKGGDRLLHVVAASSASDKDWRRPERQSDLPPCGGDVRQDRGGRRKSTDIARP